MKILYSILGIAFGAMISLAGFFFYIHTQNQEAVESLKAKISELQSNQAQELALITSSFRELQRGIQLENTELEKLLQKQEQDFVTQIQDIERQKSISDRLLTQDNQKLAENISELSEKLLDLETISKPALIAKWSDVTVKIRCEYENQPRTFGSGMYIGTGFDIDFGAGNDHVILSNSHVLEEGGEIPTSCSILWNDGAENEVVIVEDDIAYFGELDAAYLRLASEAVPQFVQNTVATYGTCDLLPTSGDELIILGYPRIGSSDGITSTEGIVSGYDEPFYVTSAKISKGSSGGLAVSVARDCYVGIPTLVRADEVESLGRILDIQALLQ